LGPIPNPQSPIPNPQSPIPYNYNKLNLYLIFYIKFILRNILKFHKIINE